jgi:hypothetical protein
MKTLTILAALALALPDTALAGDLTPPPGPVSATMKTLDQVEPRIPVESLPADGTFLHVISEPGSYMLTSHLVVAGGGSGVLIDARDVTLDLMGFCVSTPDPTAAKSGTGIQVGASATETAVRNGRVTGFSVGLSLGSNDSLAEDLLVTLNTTGITGSRIFIRRCVARDNLGSGLVSEFGRVEDSIASDNGGSGIHCQGSVISCVADDNEGNGISSYNSMPYAEYRDNRCTNNGGNGLWVFSVGPSGQLVIGNCARGNQGDDLTVGCFPGNGPWQIVMSNQAWSYVINSGYGTKAAPIVDFTDASVANPFANVQL